MEVQLTAEQSAFIREAIEAGRLQRPEEAVQEALLLWEEQQRRRLVILAAVDRAEASLAARKGRQVNTHAEVRQLADDVRRRGLARLNAEKTTAP